MVGKERLDQPCQPRFVRRFPLVSKIKRRLVERYWSSVPAGIPEPQQECGVT